MSGWGCTEATQVCIKAPCAAVESVAACPQSGMNELVIVQTVSAQTSLKFRPHFSMGSSYLKLAPFNVKGPRLDE